MIKVCGEGRGVETSMKLEVVGKRGRRSFVIVVLALDNFRVEVETPDNSGKECLFGAYADSDKVIASLGRRLRLRPKDRLQAKEQITQFFSRHGVLRQVPCEV